MSVRYAYIVVEGPHDVELVARLLKPLGLKRVQKQPEVDPYWRRLIPTSFPPPPDLDLLRRVSVPFFFQNTEVSLAIHAATGESRIAQTIEESLTELRPSPASIGVVLDADQKATPRDRFAELKAKLAASKDAPVALPDEPGEITPGPPRTGVFVLPDNHQPGTLEDLLLEGAATSYPSLLVAAHALVAGVNPKDAAFNRDDMADFTKPAGRNKATVACIAGVLRPGKAVQVSIQDNRWLEGASCELPRIKAVRVFLYELLGIPGASSLTLASAPPART
ncbi:DUF3226 domain-containing protein [Polyangium spumosum]|uniref:Uncharacterized protein n=1 Tax=Polyangium spumosum TaxID=889282 RepID=A0A6N7PR57_9BACT|nr:DUF3226 domain-containing protein [Polyangium spumosum]MRG94097.1 hypothetical protein [Polyangium spumosum]